MKLKEIKEFGGHPNDWLEESSDEEILRLVDEMIDYSGYLKRECARLGVPYFDQSESFTDTVQAVLNHLEGGVSLS